MQTVVITGGTGMIGQALTKELLRKGHFVIILSRTPAKHSHHSRLTYAAWDPKRRTIDQDAIRAAHCIVNLAGANIGEKRWTRKRKTEIRESRVLAGRVLSESLSNLPNHVEAVIQASAVGWYGDNSNGSGDGFVESDPAAPGFLGETCAAWEESIAPVKGMGKRLVILRTGIVVSSSGGVVEEFLKPLRFRIGAIPGSGRQWMSWIHLQDLVNLYIKAIEEHSMEGIFNAVAPHPALLRQIVVVIASKTRGEGFVALRIPAFLLKVVLGQMSVEILKSTRVSAEKIQNLGFQFQFPDMLSAIENLEIGQKKKDRK